MAPRTDLPRFAALRTCTTRRCRSNWATVRSDSCKQDRSRWTCLQRPALKPSLANSPTGGVVYMDRNRLEDTYYHSRVFSREQYTAFIRLLEIFGQQLSAVANRLIVQDAEAEPPMIRRTVPLARISAQDRRQLFKHPLIRPWSAFVIALSLLTYEPTMVKFQQRYEKRHGVCQSASSTPRAQIGVAGLRYGPQFSPQKIIRRPAPAQVPAPESTPKPVGVTPMTAKNTSSTTIVPNILLPQ
jgi:hypothetical protein